MEILDVYNLNKERTKRKVTRDGVFDMIDENERILLVHTCIFNSENKMLIQQRQMTKDRYPGCWDVSAGGFVVSGENSIDAAKRETAEELGLEIEPECFELVCCEPFGKVFDDFYNVYTDVTLSEAHLQAEEIMAVSWASIEEVRQLLNSGRFVDYSEELIKRVFDAAETRNSGGNKIDSKLDTQQTAPVSEIGI